MDKKAAQQSSPAEAPFESIPKHQHNTAPQHLRLVQYGLKIPNSQHQHLLNNLHQHAHQSPYQTAPHRYIQASTPQYIAPNIQTNPMHHQYTNESYTWKVKQQPNSNLHVHNAINHQGTQIWVPHQPPPTHQIKSDIQPTPKQAKLPKEPVDRKKSTTGQQLRSPSAKRPPDAPVTLQGWLYKQGSEGFMLWKKRWFVLSEYCLFYYKSSEEEKLLGSILLPSYKVSICGPDEKVNKKFAFKCEHTNMRTYVLAADSQELMMQWVRNLNLASLLQTNLEAEASDANNQLYYSQSNENSDSGFNQQYTNARSTPLHTHSSSNTTDLSNPNHELSQYNQPLYANAPPKPRRLNDGGYSSPSPDVLDKCGEPKYVTLQPPGYMQRNVSGSPCYRNQEYLPERSYEHSINQNVVQSMERRTPDTYGRSKSYSAKDKQIDYEDVYSVHRMYKRPLSPLASSDKRPVIVAPRKVYTPVSIIDSRDMPYTHYLRKSPNTIPRPHSADFLEYEINNKQIGHIHRQPRPKSSLDINRNASNDNYFYSEERYAEKMRKSALYLSKLPKQAAMLPAADNTFPLMRSTTQPVQYNSRAEYGRREPTMRSKSVLSEGSLSQELELDWQRNFPKSISPMQHEIYAYKDEYDPFARSASARLANIEQRLQGDGRNAINKEGERKREESMKRLLEWKQRMLQSPLNRKMNQNVNKSSGKLEVYKNQDNYNVKYMDMYREKGKHGNPFNYYNSYSSDDEENMDRSKETMQAGRTLETMSTETAPYTPISVLTTQNDTPVKPSTPNKESTYNEAPLVAQIDTPKTEKEQEEDTSTKDCDELMEENYMTMTPRKNIFESASSDTKEENPYVEMTQRINALDPDNVFNVAEQQPYEMLCFLEGQMEPLYMELHQPKQGAPETPAKVEIPDILRNPDSKSSKSESSDADDEASKDLESLDTPSHPRFSLSDTFRPASYYLGASQNVPEFQDSSDSELVSPPPIPPHLLDDFDKSELKQNSEPYYKNRTKYAKNITNLLDSKKPSFLSLNSCKDNDSCSIGSCNTDSDARLSRLSQNSDLDVELRMYSFRNSSYERMLKRRPVFEEFCDELNSSDVLESTKNDHYYENVCVKGRNVSPNSTLALSPISMYSHERENSRDVTHSDISDVQRGSEPSFDTREIHLGYFANSSAAKTFSQPAPYYYSDLSINTTNTENDSILTLNNQRESNNGKRDIMHIINPIKSPQQLASEARSASVDFLNLTDKSGKIDNKNLYESDTLKRLKVMDSTSSIQSNPEMRNIYPNNNTEKFNVGDEIRRSHSLEGLLENALNENECQLQNTVEQNADTEASYLWEEDAIWRERLRSASQRHTKSLDDLDSIGESKKTPKKAPRGITRDVTYVNDNFYNMPFHGKDKYKQNGKENRDSFLIDREKLRQWDLMSSAPSDTQVPEGVNRMIVNTDLEAGGDTNRTSDPDTQEPASGSMSLNTRDNYARNMLSRHMWNSTQQIHTKSASNLNRSHDSDYAISAAQQDYYIPHTPSQYDISVDRTSKAQLHMMDAAKRMENLQKLEHIKQHLLELEKQYEKGKPLVNLVDNMVKLGSLYRSPLDKNTSVRDRLEFNQQIQERRLLAEERRDWNRLNSSHMQLQEKVQQLYQLDRLIQEESGTLQGLQHDKEEIERALGGLKRRLMQGFSDPTKIEQARKQQAILENELSRVHLMLAQNSKKLEETVAGNARLEQELLVLKQKLQISRQNRSSPQFSTADDSLPCVVGTNIILESDLQKVQQKVSDLQRQRQDLSMQVRQLTDRSSSLQQSAKPATEQNEKHQSTQAAANKKKMHSLWRETDLDTMNIIDHGDMWKHPASPTSPALYVNTEAKSDESEYFAAAVDSGSDDVNQNFMPQEKQEIKTVRIVKRESERRQRDRERSVVSGKWEAVSEEEEPQKPEPYFEAEEKSPELSPVFKSEAARQIITEMSQDAQPKQQLHRRAVPKEKRRHYTAPHNNLLIKSLNELPTDENAFDKMLVNTRRARDDLDMERALRQRIDAPDVVRSTLSNKELKYNESTIDNLLGTPNKINIPERYIPEQLPQLSAEEQEQRMKKVESIKKMLSDTTILSASTANLAADDVESTSTVTTKATTKMIEEKKQREHLLQLNQILAKQVMEMSKIVAVKALAKLPLHSQQVTSEEDDLSPVVPLPLYQQRDNFYS